MNDLTKIIDACWQCKSFDYNIAEADIKGNEEKIRDLYGLFLFYHIASKDVLEDFRVKNNIPIDKMPKVEAEAYAKFDFGFYLWKSIAEERMSSILNCGTGWGASVAFCVQSGVYVDSLEHIPIFTNITKFMFDRIRDIGSYLPEYRYNLIDCKTKQYNGDYLPLFRSDKYQKFTHKRNRQDLKPPFSIYDFEPEMEYDAVIVDGPSFFRLPTALSLINHIRDDGLLIFEGGRKEVSFLKFAGFEVESKGRSMNTPVRIKGKKHHVHSYNALRINDEVKEKLMNLP